MEALEIFQLIILVTIGIFVWYLGSNLDSHRRNKKIRNIRNK